jgi:phenylalanyl-tRNA synthetase alpha chain
MDTLEPHKNTLQNKLHELRQSTLQQVAVAATTDDLEKIRRAVLGRSGSLNAELRAIKNLDEDDRRTIGALANRLKLELTEALSARAQAVVDATSDLYGEFDVTRPGVAPNVGGLHPTIQMMYDLNDAFASLNFEIYDGPEITSEYFAFDSLNFRADHPARDSMDTYWLEGYESKRGVSRLCLRPHLTGESVRHMRESKPPFRFVYPGRVYRNEAVDSSHERAFFQYEALIVEKHLPFTAGRLLIDTILDTVFGRHVETRMRAGFFPFVEPGFEIDMQCQVCAGTGCKVCKYVGWLELMPGGPPHPNVLRAANVDPSEWEGFYINVGLDRLVMMRYGIRDVRLFHKGDLRFLNQFR